LGCLANGCCGRVWPQVPGPPMGRAAITRQMAVRVWEEAKYKKKKPEDDRTLVVDINVATKDKMYIDVEEGDEQLCICLPFENVQPSSQQRACVARCCAIASKM
ncbi:unnamed protein product, partial [Ectocarpus sp. 12 AP-2014]